MNAKTFTVRESGLVVVGMPYDDAIRSFKSAAAAERFAAKWRAERAPVAGSGVCAELRAAWSVRVVAS